jgi:WD40 repeat protein
VWRAADGDVLAVLQGPSRQVWKVAFSPDSTRVAAVSADGSAQLWDADSGRPALMLRGHADEAWAVAFAPDGRSLVTGSWDRTARLWGVSPGEIARRRAGSGR